MKWDKYPIVDYESWEEYKNALGTLTDTFQLMVEDHLDTLSANEYMQNINENKRIISKIKAQGHILIIDILAKGIQEYAPMALSLNVQLIQLAISTVRVTIKTLLGDNQRSMLFRVLKEKVNLNIEREITYFLLRENYLNPYVTTFESMNFRKSLRKTRTPERKYQEMAMTMCMALHRWLGQNSVLRCLSDELICTILSWL